MNIKCSVELRLFLWYRFCPGLSFRLFEEVQILWQYLWESVMWRQIIGIPFHLRDKQTVCLITKSSSDSWKSGYSFNSMVSSKLHRSCRVCWQVTCAPAGSSGGFSEFCMRLDRNIKQLNERLDEVTALTVSNLTLGFHNTNPAWQLYSC